MDTPYRLEIVKLCSENNREYNTYEIHKYAEGRVAIADTYPIAWEIVDKLNAAARGVK